MGKNIKTVLCFFSLVRSNFKLRNLSTQKIIILQRRPQIYLIFWNQNIKEKERLWIQIGLYNNFIASQFDTITLKKMEFLMHKNLKYTSTAEITNIQLNFKVKNEILLFFFWLLRSLWIYKKFKSYALDNEAIKHCKSPIFCDREIDNLKLIKNNQNNEMLTKFIFSWVQAFETIKRRIILCTETFLKSQHDWSYTC